MGERGRNEAGDTGARRPGARSREWVCRLEALGREDIALSGGKGSSLGEMLRAGLPVPEGFVVLTTAYRAFVSDNGLQTEIQRLAGEVPAGDMGAIEETCRSIHRLFAGGAIPEEITRAVTTAYEALGGGPVAVRSSATAEDLPGASFAGQHDSYLNIDGAGAVCAAVKRCWASLWNPRALSYRRRQRMDRDDVAIAVVVQRMIPAERAGVLFTANPLNHRRDQMLLSASWGLGEAVVGGEVTPDQWVVDAASGAILEARIADKRVMTVRDTAGTATREMPASLREASTLDAGEIAELVALGQAATAFFGEPQDIEWAWATGRVYLVQSRPITALFPLPEPYPHPTEGLRLYLCASVHAQQMVEPMTPMGIEFWRALTAGFASAATGRPEREVSWFKVAAGRMFIDVTELLRNPKWWPRVAGALAEKDPITAEALNSFLEREGDAIARKGRGLRIPLRLVPLGVRLGWRAVLAAVAPERARRRLLRETEAAIEALEAEAGRLMGVTERVRFVEVALGQRGAVLWLTPVAVMSPGLAAEDAASARVERWLGDAIRFAPIRRALPHNPTTEMGLELWRLARRLKAQGEEPTASHPGVAEFLARYGHRAVWEIDPGVPRWSEDPTYLLEILGNYMAQADAVDAERQFYAHETAAQEAAEALVAHVHREQGRLRAWLLRWLIRLYREMGGLREQPKFEGARLVALARRVLQAAGYELVERGRLDDAEDVFFLTLADLRAAAAESSGAEDSGSDLRTRAAHGRSDYRRELERRTVPRWMTSIGECIFGVPTAETEGVLTGLPVSPGIYKGTARVVLHPTGARIEPGEVLVCRGTDPAWTPLFLTAGALVMETGGAVSHGSVVAREYGLPAVAGVADATERLRDGQRVQVNGETGQVTVLD